MAHEHRHGHDEGDHHADGVGHHHDQGVLGALRYLRLLPRLWRSEVNDAVVRRLELQPGERMLDIGAGMGAGVVAAAAAGARVVAVEPTPFMRGLLRARLLPARLVRRAPGSVEVVTGAAERLAVPDDSADAICAVNTLHHWSSLERGVAEIARVLAPGGRVLLVDEDFADPRHPEHHRFGAVGAPSDRHGFLTVEGGQLGDLLRAHGLTSVEPVAELAGRPVVGVTAKAKRRRFDGEASQT